MRLARGLAVAVGVVVGIALGVVVGRLVEVGVAVGAEQLGHGSHEVDARVNASTAQPATNPVMIARIT